MDNLEQYFVCVLTFSHIWRSLDNDKFVYKADNGHSVIHHGVKPCDYQICTLCGAIRRKF